MRRADKFDDPLVGSLREITLPAKSPMQLVKDKAMQLGFQNLTELSEAIIEKVLDTGKESVHYNAVSYVWGSKDENVSLLCDDNSIEITKNCDAMLRYHRGHNEDRTL